jgi:hypothetical protein
MKLKLVCAVAWVGLLANAGPGWAQIISTSTPSVAGKASDQRFAFHAMGGYASWEFAGLSAIESETGSEFSRPDGFIVAGDLIYEATDTISVGGGAWFNTAKTEIDLSEGGFQASVEADITITSGYANVFYKKIGVQFGFVRNSATITGMFLDEVFEEEEVSSTDRTYFLVGRLGGERWAVGVGGGLYQFDEGGGTFTAFVNASYKVLGALSIDAGGWYIGESDIGDDQASRATLGLGYTF